MHPSIGTEVDNIAMEFEKEMDLPAQAKICGKPVYFPEASADDVALNAVEGGRHETNAAEEEKIYEAKSSQDRLNHGSNNSTEILLSDKDINSEGTFEQHLPCDKKNEQMVNVEEEGDKGDATEIGECERKLDSLKMGLGKNNGASGGEYQETEGEDSPGLTTGRRPKKYHKEDDSLSSWRHHKKHFLVLSNAGKPIYSRYGDEYKLAGFSGILQALMSYVENEGDKIRVIKAGTHLILFLVKGPLYLVSIASTGEPVQMLRDQLDLLYGQVIMVLTASVNRTFLRNPKFDMHGLLDGTHPMFTSLITAFSWNYGATLKAYGCLRLPHWCRHAANGALWEGASSAPPDDVMLALLLCGDKVVTLGQRAKAAPLHIYDIFLLINFVTASDSFRSSESFSPVCLPRYNAATFVYTYVNYLAADVCLILVTPASDAFFRLQDCRNAIESSLAASGALREISAAATAGGLRVDQLPQRPASRATTDAAATSASLWLSQQQHFQEEDEGDLESQSQRLLDEELAAQGLLDEGFRDAGFRDLRSLSEAEKGGEAEGEAGEAETASTSSSSSSSSSSASGLLHFVYRSNQWEQFVAAEYTWPLTNRSAQKRLFRSYQKLRASMLGSGGRLSGHKMQYRRDDEHVMLAWRTLEFEIYVAFDPLVDKRSAIAICNRVSQWVKSLEAELFLRKYVQLP